MPRLVSNARSSLFGVCVLMLSVPFLYKSSHQSSIVLGLRWALPLLAPSPPSSPQQLQVECAGLARAHQSSTPSLVTEFTILMSHDRIHTSHDMYDKSFINCTSGALC